MHLFLNRPAQNPGDPSALPSVLTHAVSISVCDAVKDEPHDATFQAWLKENRTIGCPTCGQGLQKQEGCNHLQ